MRYAEMLRQAVNNKQHNIIHNKKIIRESSWVYALFEEYKLTRSEKKEIWKRLFQNEEEENEESSYS